MPKDGLEGSNGKMHFEWDFSFKREGNLIYHRNTKEGLAFLTKPVELTREVTISYTGASTYFIRVSIFCHISINYFKTVEGTGGPTCGTTDNKNRTQKTFLRRIVEQLYSTGYRICKMTVGTLHSC